MSHYGDGIYIVAHHPEDGVGHYLHCFAQIAVADIQVETHIGRTEQRIHIHHFTRLLAPDVFHQIRIVDKRIAVALCLLDGIIAVHLFLRHRVLTVPLEQHRQSVVGQAIVVFGCIVGVGIDGSIEDYSTVFVQVEYPFACPLDHGAEIATGDIAFVFVGWL